MPRQIVPVTDVDAILLTQQEGDERYLPITYSPPPVDLSLYYTKVQSDARYEPIDTMYTKAESDAKYLTQVLADARYSLLSHLHTDVYQPVGSYSLTTHNHDTVYSPTAHNHDSVYVNTSGDDTMAGVLTSGGTNTGYLTVWGGWKFQDEGGNLVWRNPDGTQNRLVFWGDGHTSMSGSFDVGGTLSSGAGQNIFAGGNVHAGSMYANGLIQAGYGAAAYTYYKANGIEKHGSGALDIWSADGQNIQLNPGGTIIHPPNETVHLGWDGLRWATVRVITVLSDTTQAGGSGGQNIQMTYHQFRKNGGGHIQVAGAGNFEPEADNFCILGGNVNRWQSVWSNNGSINTCHAVSKKNFTPLDPVACTQAVLETEWLSYEYLPPPAPPPLEGETPKERMAVLDEYLLAAAKTYVSRKQNGYVLGHPTHKTHDLFGLTDRQSASPSSDLGILACALQAALQRIAALEALQGVAP